MRRNNSETLAGTRLEVGPMPISGWTVSMRRVPTWRAFCALAMLAVSPARSSDGWPDQLYAPAHIRVYSILPGDNSVLAALGFGFCARGARLYRRPGIKRGGLMAIRGSALFFATRNDLDLFEGPRHAITPDVKFLPHSHPVMALEDIPSESAGGRVRDAVLGDGFVRWERDSDEVIPDPQKLPYSVRGSLCGGHDFLNYPVKPGRRILVRPPWPKIRDIHTQRRLNEEMSRGHSAKQRPVLESDF